MTENRKYTDRVAAGDFPEDPRVPLDDTFSNENGLITNILFGKCASVARLFSKRGAVRANHWHRTDWHYAIVESGSVLYFHRAVGSTEIPEPIEFTEGQVFFTPPNREHAMLFTRETVLYTLAQNVRTHEEHEADLVRVEFITPTIREQYLYQ